MTIRDSIAAIVPEWLDGFVAKRLMWSIGLVLDADWTLTEEGIKARMPGVGTPEALPYIGADRLIDKGPAESNESYAARLSSAFDTWRGAGNPYKLLEQLRSYFLPSPPALRVVSDNSIWHEIDPTTGDVTRTKVSPRNWVWDPFAADLTDTPRWHRGWVIIDSSNGPWSQWMLGEPGVTLGDGHTLGSTATVDEVASVQRIVRRWKPQHVHAMHVIVTFDPTLFRTINAPGSPMPSGDYDQYDNRAPDAAYWEGAI